MVNSWQDEDASVDPVEVTNQDVVCEIQKISQSPEPRFHKDYAAEGTISLNNFVTQSKSSNLSVIHECLKDMEIRTDPFVITDSKPNYLQSHIRNEHKSDFHICSRCNGIFISRSALNTHACNRPKSQRNKCDACGIVMSGQYRQHIIDNHQDLLIFTCNGCGHKSLNRKLLGQHHVTCPVYKEESWNDRKEAMQRILLKSDEILRKNYNSKFIEKVRNDINLVTKKAYKCQRQGSKIRETRKRVRLSTDEEEGENSSSDY